MILLIPVKRMFCTLVLLFLFGSLSFADECQSGGAGADENLCETETTQNSLYDKEWNKWFGEIADANKLYTPCSKDDNCTCYNTVIESDLAPFVSEGISKDMIDKVSTHGTKYQIIDHKIYRQESCMFPSRCAGIEYFIKNIIKDLPDMELIINCRDWPQIPKTYGKYGPVFSFSKTSDYFDIMYPTWSFWEGGPAISLHPTGIGRWDKHRNIISMAAKKMPWESKKSLGFFRGSRTSDERDSIVLLSRNQPELVDAQYTKNQAWKSPKDTLNAEPAKEVSFEDHCQYKYLFNFRGVAASFRLKHLFLCKSLVFHIGDDWNEFFYFSLKPWVHYVPLNSYPTQEELASILKFFTKHDSLGKEIAHRGYKHIWDHLRMKDIECYWKKLLLDYAIILKYKVELDKNLIKIK